MGNRTKLTDIRIDPNDLDSILNMSITSLKAGRPPKFPDTPEGLEDFKALSIEYLEFVQKNNENPANENKLIPDVESWAVFLGTTRMTINVYERERSSEWNEFIVFFKGILTSIKKQLAFRQKIPCVLAMFDLCNNSGYLNTNNFTRADVEFEPKQRRLTADELPSLLAKIGDKNIVP